MIGDDEQIGGRAEGRVLVGQQPRIDVAVRADEGQLRDRVVELPRDAPLPWVRGEEYDPGAATLSLRDGSQLC